MEKTLRDIRRRIQQGTEAWERERADELKELENGLYGHYRPCTMTEADVEDKEKESG